jgi:hypothetical protein
MIERFLNKHRQVSVWPAKDVGRIIVLNYLIEKFVPNTNYSETQVNQILKQWHTFEDWALLRRELFDRGYFEREPDGTRYSRTSL